MNRIQARENAFILLFESVMRTEATAQEIYDLAVSERQLETNDYVKEVFFGVDSHREQIDRAIEDNLRGWNINRVSAVSKALCRLAIYELLFREDIPMKVSINEAVELSKKYDDEKSYLFVNGVLNAVAKQCGKQ